MVSATTRWWWRSRRNQLVSHLLPRFVLWFLVSVQVDAMASLEATSRALLAQPPWASALLFLGLTTTVLVDERRFVRQLVLGPGAEVLRRQPVPPWAHGPGVALLLTTVATPLLGAGLLAWRSPTAPLLWGAAALLPVLLVAARQHLLALAALAVGAAAVLVGHGWPWLRLPVAILLGAGVVPLLGQVAFHHALPHEGLPVGAPWRSRSQLAAVVQRDLLVLWRRERPLLLSAASAAPVAAVVVGAARINGPFRGWTLAIAASVLLVMVGPASLAALAALVRHLGAQLDPPRWPLSAVGRATALVVVAAVPVSPAWAGAALAGGADLGLSAQAGVAALATSVCTGAAAFAALRPRRPDHGLFLW